MMQTTEKAIQEQFLQDVGKLKTRFPLARIVELTGEDKGNVSKFLNRKLIPSEAFLRKFYEAFGLPLPDVMNYTVSITKPHNQIAPTENDVLISQLRDEIKELKKELKEERELNRKFMEQLVAKSMQK